MDDRFLKMDQALYEYVLAHGVREHPEQVALRAATRGYPNSGMQISPEQGQLMALLVKLLGARNTIEIGVFTGYSALSVALALPPGGRILACDIDEKAPALGRPHWQRAGVADRIDLRIGSARATLDACLAAGEADGYDFAFIDADKTGYDDYYERCLRLVRPGGLLMIDNTLWSGAVASPSDDASTKALQALNRKVHGDERVEMVLLPFSDGVTLARRK